jgi:CO/xanthine dehydrogenase Mo-binding subunit
LPKVIEAAATAAGWRQADGGRWEREKTVSSGTDLPPHKKRGVAIAAGYKNVGYSFGFPEQTYATIEIHGGGEIEKVVVKMVGADVGQGAHTVFRQMAAEGVGVSVEQVELQADHTDLVGSSGSSSASRMTMMAGNAIKGAAERALRLWNDEVRPATATFRYKPRATSNLDHDTGEGDPHITYGYVAEVAEVEIDTDTGLMEVLRVVCADDVGKAINPRLIEGQIEGAVVQATGYSILENFVTVDSRIKTSHLSTYLIPTVYDIPHRTESVILEIPDPQGPWGARGMAEMPMVVLAPAIASAVFDAVGVWVDEIPLTPDRVLGAMEAGRKTQDAENG